MTHGRVSDSKFPLVNSGSSVQPSLYTTVLCWLSLGGGDTASPSKNIYIERERSGLVIKLHNKKILNTNGTSTKEILYCILQVFLSHSYVCSLLISTQGMDMPRKRRFPQNFSQLNLYIYIQYIPMYKIVTI